MDLGMKKVVMDLGGSIKINWEFAGRWSRFFVYFPIVWNNRIGSWQMNEFGSNVVVSEGILVLERWKEKEFSTVECGCASHNHNESCKEKKNPNRVHCDVVNQLRIVVRDSEGERSESVMRSKNWRMKNSMGMWFERRRIIYIATRKLSEI